ncbi:MAG TPA: DUF1800 family protein [Solirubrobacteraceae bacterium]|jgi:uncharacterized protein (DUF1800 family)
METTLAAPAGLDAYTGTFGVREATRLLWRAGFGPRRGEAATVASLGLDAAITSLTRPSGAPVLQGPEPYTEFSPRLNPGVEFEHDHLAWFDRMIRSSQPFVERMALLWHDWFGVAVDVGRLQQYNLMARHVQLFRTKGLGSFRQLLLDITADGAMLVRLDGDENAKGRPNENYAREMMELYALGPDRGAYTERDVREAARGLTGYTDDYAPSQGGFYNFRYEAERHDDGAKTVFGKTAAYEPAGVVDACVAHPLHPSFLVLKLWSAFIAVPPPEDQRKVLERVYLANGFRVRPVVEAILRHRLLYEGPALVKPPVVQAAGLLRAIGRGIETIAWTGETAGAGQHLYHPPNIAGWREDRWLDTSSLRYRWQLAFHALKGRQWQPGQAYPATETAQQAVGAALRFWDDPPAIRADTRTALVRAATRMGALATPGLTASERNGYRQNVLRHLVAGCHDNQVS